MGEVLGFDERAGLAVTQLGMELSGGGVMTARRLGELAAGWGDGGDEGEVLAEVWSRLVGATRPT